MYFLLLVLSLIITAYNVTCEVNSYDYSEDRPLTFLYAVYPYYSSEALLQVWKTDKAVDISANVVTLTPFNQGTASYPNNGLQINGTSSKTQNGGNFLLNDADNINLEPLSQSRQRLTNYRNRQKVTNLQNEG